MLQIIGGPALRTDDYRITRKEDGMDELRLSVSINDPVYRELREEQRILETIYQQTYTVKHINGGATSASIICQLDLDDWREGIHLFDTVGDNGGPGGYKSGLRTAGVILQDICPDDWSVTGDLSKTDKCAITMQGPTDLEIAMQVQDRFGCRLRFDNARKTVCVVYPGDQPVSNGYIVDTVNLRGVPYYTGASDKVYTRIYPVGFEGLTIESVNGDVPYLEDKSVVGSTISCLWSDARYEDPESLMAAAKLKLQEAARPTRSWEIDAVDLKAIDPDRWPDMGLELFRRVRLVDRYRGVSEIVQIVEQEEYPHYPERNRIKLSTATQSAGKRIRQLTEQLANGNSELWQKLGG